ncbi:hypothetical protein AA313_de0203450 [Arthrobotrys entomopaga]|nr:hypothetical protein AA313_de0203450 [Arthrobotrys entomopaga]
MKFTVQIAASILCLVASTTAKPISARDVAAAGIPGTDATNYGFNGGPAAAMNAPPYAFIKARATEKSAKDWALERAKARKLNQTQIDFLESVPAESFEKMRTTHRKLHQAFTMLWKGDIPKMDTLPEPDKKNSTVSATTKDPKPLPTTNKGWFQRWASRHDLPADKLKLLDDAKESEFDALMDKNTKDRLIGEAKIMKLDDKVKFFQDKVPAPVYAELDKLRETAKSFRQSMKKMEKPKL